jgi:acyl-CoA thioester hydrolase
MTDLAFDPKSRAAFRHWTSLPIRFGDQDPLGHVNNAAIAAYLEHARCELALPIVRAAGVPNLDIVLARIVIDYLRELRYPGSVDVGTRIGRIGNKSFSVIGSVFSGETCAVVAEATIVCFDTATRRATLPPETVRQALAALA